MTQVLTREIEVLRLLMGSSSDPRGRAFAQLGDALRRSGSHSEALAILLDGVEEHPNFSPGHLVLAWAAQDAGDLEVARAAFRRTLELDGDNPFALYGLGRIQLRDGDPGAREMVERAEELYPSVRDASPALPEAEGQDDLAGLPFMALEDLAPAPAPGGVEEMDDLPFISLEELAPGPAATPAAIHAPDELDLLPFIPLEDLAPASAPEFEPTDSDEGPQGDVVATEMEMAALPFISLDDLGPESGEDVSPDEDTSPGEEAGSGMDAELGEEAGSGMEEEEDEQDGTLVTRTMGELMVRQGLMAQAIQVFEQLVEEQPHDQALRDRLQELRAGGGGAGVTEPAVPPTSEREDVEPGSQAESVHPSMVRPEPDPDLPSPFGFHGHDEAEEEGPGGSVESEASAGDYFGRLLAWAPEEGSPSRDVPSGSDPSPRGEEDR